MCMFIVLKIYELANRGNIYTLRDFVAFSCLFGESKQLGQ